MRFLQTVRWAGALVRLQSFGRRTLGTALFSFVLVCASAALAAGLFSRADVAERWDEAARRFDAPDIVLTTSTNEALDRVRTIDGVTSKGWRVKTMQGVSLAAARSPNELTSVDARLFRPNDPPVAMIVDGRWLDPSDSNAIVLDAGLAESTGMRAGDRIAIRRNGNQFPVTVVGVALDFTNCMVPLCSPANVWIPAAMEQVLGPPDRTTYVEGFTLAETTNPAEVARIAYADSRQEIRIAITSADVRELVVLGNGVLGNVVAEFGLLALVAAGIIVSSTTSVRISQLRRDLGLLQVIGASGRSVAVFALLQNLVIGLVSATIGWLLAVLARDRLVVGVARVIPELQRPPIGNYAAVLLSVTTLVALSTLAPAVRLLLLEPVDALKPRRMSGSGAVGIVPSSSVRLAGRILLTQRRHVAVSFVALLVTSTAAVAAVGYDAALSAFASGEETISSRVDDRITPQTEGEGIALDGLLDEDRAVSAWWQESYSAVLVDGSTAQGRFIGGDIGSLGLELVDGRYPASASEAVIGYGLVQRTNAQVGDVVTVVAENRVFSVTIVGHVRAGANGGRMILLPLDDLDVTARWALRRSIRFAPGVDQATASARLRAVVTDRTAPTVPTDNSATAKPFRLALLALAAAVLAVGIGQLISSLVLMVRGTARDLATLRTVGLDDRDIARAHMSVVAVIAIVATVFALPLGWFAYRWSIDRLSIEMGIGPGVKLPSPLIGHFRMSSALLVASLGLAAVTLRSQLNRSIASALRAE